MDANLQKHKKKLLKVTSLHCYEKHKEHKCLFSEMTILLFYCSPDTFKEAICNILLIRVKKIFRCVQNWQYHDINCNLHEQNHTEKIPRETSSCL